MREFIVTLTHGEKLTVRADRVACTDHQYLGLVLESSESESPAATVAIFERSRVAMVVSREHLVSQERCEPLDPAFVVDQSSEIPF